MNDPAARAENAIWSSTAIVLLGWGVLSLGATRPWGYYPLMAGMATFGAASLVQRGRSTVGRGLSCSLAAVCIAIFVQTIPLPLDTIAVLSPQVAARHGAADAGLRHTPLSIDPRATALGLAFVAALGLFFVGAVRTMGRDGARRIASGIVGLGVLVALVGIAEAGTEWDGMYRMAAPGLPPDSTPHGPFASRNHYAAWMLMALALTLSYLCGIADRAQWPRTEKVRMVGLLSAAALMAIALVQTQSRAGLFCLGLAIVTMSVIAARRLRGAWTRVGLATSLGLLLAVGIVATGVRPITERLRADSWATAHGRTPIWRQAAAIARDFPVTGSGFNTYSSIVSFYPTPEIDEPYEGAHNDYLQLAAEGGMLVGLPLLSTVGFFVWDTRKRLREPSSNTIGAWLRVGAIVGLVVLAIQESVEFSLQIPGNAALFAVLAAIAVHRTRPDASTALRRSW